MANRHMKRCLISLIIEKIQFKTTMKYHVPLIRMTVLKERKGRTSVGKHGVKRDT